MWRFFVGNFLSQSDEKFRRGTILYFRKNLYSKSFMHRRGRAVYHVFPSKLSCFKVPKLLVAESFSPSLISEIETFYAQDGYMTNFC